MTVATEDEVTALRRRLPSHVLHQMIVDFDAGVAMVSKGGYGSQEERYAVYSFPEGLRWGQHSPERFFTPPNLIRWERIRHLLGQIPATLVDGLAQALAYPAGRTFRPNRQDEGDRAADAVYDWLLGIQRQPSKPKRGGPPCAFTKKHRPGQDSRLVTAWCACGGWKFEGVAEPDFAQACFQREHAAPPTAPVIAAPAHCAYIEQVDDKYAHLVSARCACGSWRFYGSAAPFVVRRNFGREHGGKPVVAEVEPLGGASFWDVLAAAAA